MTGVRTLCEQCREERLRWRFSGDKASPGCAGLFRAWYAGDAAAWGCVSAIFDALLTSWVSKFIAQLGSPSLFTAEDVPEIVHDVHVRIRQNASDHPEEAAQRVAGSDISGVLGYTEVTAKRRVLELYRKRRRRREEPLPPEDEPEQEEEGRRLPSKVPATADFSGRVIEAALIEEARRRCLSSEAEAVVALEILLNGVKSSEVLVLYPDLFANIGAVYETTRRVKRCLRHVLEELNS